VPITEKMRDGNEPMRTFGDLMQFFNQAKIPPEQPGDSAGENTSA